MSLIALIKGIDKFFFYPSSPTPVALFRILLGLILLQDIFIYLLPGFKFFFGEHSLVPIESTLAYSWGRDNYLDILLLLPPGDHWKMLVLLILIASTICTTIGLFTRLSASIAFFCLLSFDSHFFLNQNMGDVLLRLSLMMVALSNSQDAFSIDNLRKACRQDWRNSGFAPRRSAPWAQRMLQLQMTFIYMQAFLSELADDRWVKGLAVYYASRYDDMIRFPVPHPFDNLPCYQAFTWGTMGIQFCLFTFIWFREFRYWIILAAIISNLAVEMSTNLPIFELLLTASYILFIEPKDLSKAMDAIKLKIHEYLGPPALLAYDGNCLFCVRTIGILHRLDIFGFLTLIDFRDGESIADVKDIDLIRAEKEMLLKVNSLWLGGSQAFRWLSLRLPLLMPLFIFFYIPGFAQIADKIYKIISANRNFIVGGRCEKGVCQAQS